MTRLKEDCKEIRSVGIEGSKTAMCDKVEGRHQGKPEVVGLRGVHTSQTTD